MDDGVDIAAIAPGAELAALLSALRPADFDDDYDVLEAVAEFARRPWSIGETPDGARAKRGPLGSLRRDNPDDEIAARLSISSGSAGFRLGLALELAGGVAGTGARL